jgi:transporter family-2 protein
MKLLLALFALAAGTCLPVQAGINVQLKNLLLKDPALTALVSFAVGTLGLLGWVLAARTPWPGLAGVGGTSLWHWSGGLLGAFFVTATVVLAPRLGAATMISLIVAGQMLAGILLDQYGLLGYAVREASPLRLLGAALIVTGVALVRIF